MEVGTNVGAVVFTRYDRLIFSKGWLAPTHDQHIPWPGSSPKIEYPSRVRSFFDASEGHNEIKLEKFVRIVWLSLSQSTSPVELFSLQYASEAVSLY